jgi:NAD(P)-dependent dehydrogenase (short-subunit alcohol dehydrogenase family)
MDIRLDGKVAIVTGGSRGIGRGIAAAMAEAGAKVMITSRKEETCAATVEDLRASTGGDLAWVAGHVGKVEDMQRVLDGTMEAFGAVDVLINNAATNPYAGPVIDIDVPRWEKTFATNLTTPLVWTQAVWNLWMKEHGGAVVNVSSVGAFGTNAILGVYDLTKRALIHLTEQLAAEVGPAVRVNAVCPGLVRTDFARAVEAARRAGGHRSNGALPRLRCLELDDRPRRVGGRRTIGQPFLDRQASNLSVRSAGQISSWTATASAASMNSSTMSRTTCPAPRVRFMVPTTWPTK